MITSDKIESMRSKVDQKQEYTATDIVRLGLLPWARSPKKVGRILDSGILKTRISGENTQKRYIVKGSDLTEYIKNYGPALMHTAKTTKQRYGKRKSKRSRESEA